MTEDFIKKLGYKSLDSRFKRISDRMIHDVRKLYKELDIDIEPNWYLLFMLLQKKENVSISFLARQLGYAHPSVVVIIKKMNNKGYLSIKEDHLDKRKQLISLSNKAFQIIPKLEILWDSCEKAILEVLDKDLTILNYLDTIDSKLEETSFHYRFKQEYLNSNQ